VPEFVVYGEEAWSSPVSDMAFGMALLLVVNLCQEGDVWFLYLHL
jgi:hypothetical protein